LCYQALEAPHQPGDSVQSLFGAEASRVEPAASTVPPMNGAPHEVNVLTIDHGSEAPPRTASQGEQEAPRPWSAPRTTAMPAPRLVTPSHLALPTLPATAVPAATDPFALPTLPATAVPAATDPFALPTLPATAVPAATADPFALPTLPAQPALPALPALTAMGLPPVRGMGLPALAPVRGGLGFPALSPLPEAGSSPLLGPLSPRAAPLVAPVSPRTMPLSPLASPRGAGQPVQGRTGQDVDDLFQHLFGAEGQQQ
jgi:hypothetical protein